MAERLREKDEKGQLADDAPPTATAPAAAERARQAQLIMADFEVNVRWHRRDARFWRVAADEALFRIKLFEVMKQVYFAQRDGTGIDADLDATIKQMIDEGDALYPHANRGEYVTAAAPGVDILVPVTGEGFDYLSGTSFAAAHVSGIIALIMERNPQMTAEAVREVLTRGAHDLGAKDFGAGLADAYASLLLVEKK